MSHCLTEYCKEESGDRSLKSTQNPVNGSVLENSITHFKIETEVAYFHNSPNDDDRRKAYLVKGDIIEPIKEQGNFYYVEFVSPKTGKQSIGWINKNTVSLTTPYEDDVAILISPVTITGSKGTKFLRRDGVNRILINDEYCKFLSPQEKAAIGYVTTFVGNECEWDGDANDDMDNLKCKVLTALDLGYQCADTHLGFLRRWFKNDEAALKELRSCPIIPNSATHQSTFNEVYITVINNQIIVEASITSLNLRAGESSSWIERTYFQYDDDSIQLIRTEKTDA